MIDLRDWTFYDPEFGFIPAVGGGAPNDPPADPPADPPGAPPADPPADPPAGDPPVDPPADSKDTEIAALKEKGEADAKRLKEFEDAKKQAELDKLEGEEKATAERDAALKERDEAQANAKASNIEAAVQTKVAEFARNGDKLAPEFIPHIEDGKDIDELFKKALERQKQFLAEQVAGQSNLPQGGQGSGGSPGSASQVKIDRFKALQKQMRGGVRSRKVTGEFDQLRRELAADGVDILKLQREGAAEKKG